MSGYFEQYGEDEERRARQERILKRMGVALLVLLVAGGILFFIFHNYAQEQQVTRFFEQLQAHNYKAAYQLWVRTDDDRKGYPFSSFMRDWGPQSDHSDVSDFKITRSRSCGSGVILTVDFGRNHNQEEKLWVERNSKVIGFSPLPGCPAPR